LGAGCAIVDIFDGKEEVILDAPADGLTVKFGTPVTFRWHIDNRKDGFTYHSFLLTDKGVNVLDGRYERAYDAGDKTELTFRGEDASFEWAVYVKSYSNHTLKRVFHSSGSRVVRIVR
jgi:hypothetical protein